MPRQSRIRHRASAVCLIVMLMGLSIVAMACSSATTTTTSAMAPSTTLAAEPTTTLPPAVGTPESNALARDLKRTSQLATTLGQLLQDQGVENDDPRVALVWALRARGQAVTARKAILEEQLELADNATKELRIQLARAAAMADPPLADELAKATALMATLGRPSSDPAAATGALESMITQLEPLMAQGQALVGSPSATTTVGG
jgi:hypothetical protein